MKEELIKETIFGQILSKKNHYFIGTDRDGKKPRIVKSKKIKDYEKSFLSQCTLYKDKRIDVPFILYLAVYNRHNLFDIDGAVTTTLDCLEMANAITNDNLCIKVISEKRLCDNPKIIYAIKPVD